MCYAPRCYIGVPHGVCVMYQGVIIGVPHDVCVMDKGVIIGVPHGVCAMYQGVIMCPTWCVGYVPYISVYKSTSCISQTLFWAKLAEITQTLI